MAYNNGFPATYQPVYYPQTSLSPQITPSNQQSNNSSIIWVQGETGAKSYLVAPNNTVTLWDSENQTIYLKSADASGMPNIRVLDYTFRDASQNKSPLDKTINDYATKKDVERLQEMIDALKAQIETPKTTTSKKKVSDDE